MPYVTSLFARKMVAAAGPDIDAVALLARVGLDAAVPWDPKVMIAADAYYAMLESIAERKDVTALPLVCGASMRCDEYGALGLAWKAAPNLRGSLSRVERYARLWTSVVAYKVQADPRGVLFVLHRSGARRLGLRLSNEATLASAVSLARQVSPVPFSPVEVLVQHDAPRRIDAHEAYFGCPIRFGAEVDGLVVSHEALDRPNILGDQGITQFLLSHLDEALGAIPDVLTLEARTKEAIARALSEGVPKMEDVARGMGLSARSLHRRLADQGVRFDALREATRRELAEGLLGDQCYSLAEIAFLTGFSDQSAFSRAFKRWAGCPPAAYRKAHLSRRSGREKTS
ncbi:AraC family transcriptional regulator [Cognatishimia sp. F0-27]|uniref:AraC family transcriptional regulator n=1 Tax=Cognatishimia sp. F0-27 TaxID=2816855 RepID=UPI001D0CAE0C|nr:AraC family transcriptional regulator [Cognatishimia sp. F0-27]MCC1491989.1 AraC family transcriptional regulator [Cognatishimia sp. F0-27]